MSQIVGHGELTEEAWGVMAPLASRRDDRRGGQWRDHWTIINGILRKLRMVAFMARGQDGSGVGALIA